MADYYCEVIVDNSIYPAGVYTFEDDHLLGWGKHTTLVQLSNYVVKETEGRVVWIKNRSRPTPDLLNQDELKQFMWTKLQSKSV